MQNDLNTKESKIELLPVLKPISLYPEFIDKIDGENKLKSNVITVIAIDDNDVYFVSGLLSENTDSANQNIINIDTEDGILENGKSAKVILAKAIDLSIIYKMSYDELVYLKFKLAETIWLDCLISRLKTNWKLLTESQPI